MLFKENGRRSVGKEVNGYGTCGPGRQSLSLSTLPNRQVGGGGGGTGGIVVMMEDCDSDCNSVSSSQGSSRRMMMGSPVGWTTSDEGRRIGGGGGGRGGSSSRSYSSGTLKALEAVVMRVIDRVREYGHGESVCSDLREHFALLPARYALNIDAERHEDVLLHMRLLQEARKAEEADGSRGSNSLDEPFAVPSVNVRGVQLWSSVELSVPSHSPPKNNGMGAGCWGLKIPKPAFGSCTNLASLGCGTSPKVHPCAGGGGGNLACLALGTRETPHPPLQSTPPESGDQAFSRPAFGNPLHMDEDSGGHSSDNEDACPSYGYEITLATSDRHGLLRHYTTAISNIRTELNIKEAHVFSTTDGMALEVFVVEGWDGDDADKLRQEVLLAVGAKEERSSKHRDAELKAAAESIQYEDWAVDYNLLVIGEKLGNGSSGQLYRGKYMSQDVAIKMIALDERHSVDTDSDSLRAFPASERLQTFKQEISIMRSGAQKTPKMLKGICQDFTEDALSFVQPLQRPTHMERTEVERALSQALGKCVTSIAKKIIGIHCLPGCRSWAARLVRHKNLVQFIGACSCWPKLCIVTELMASGSVRDVLEFRRCGLDIPSALKVFRDAARGMDFLHKRGVVHRDLKAANLLMDEQDVVKVCDFGVARLKPIRMSSSGKGGWTSEMTAETGTYRWMAPEVLEHKPYDHKVDVYSFGIMMWEVLTGGVPYDGFTPLQAAIGVVQRGLRPEIPPFVPEKLSLLAQQCWHQDPKQRPEFSEVLAALEEMVMVQMTNRRFIFGGRKTRKTLLHA